MLCPNESTCKFERKLMPLMDGTETTYEQVDETFTAGDLCNY